MRREEDGHAVSTDLQVVVRLLGGKSLTARELAEVTRRPKEGVRLALERLRAAKLVRLKGANFLPTGSRAHCFQLTQAGERAAEKWRARALEDLAAGTTG